MNSSRVTKSLGHAVRLRRSQLRQAMLDFKFVAEPVKLMLTGRFPEPRRDNRSVNPLPLSVSIFDILIGQAREVWVLADHSKIDQVRPAVIDKIAAADLLITDDAAPDGFLDAVRAKGVRVMVV